MRCRPRGQYALCSAINALLCTRHPDLVTTEFYKKGKYDMHGEGRKFTSPDYAKYLAKLAAAAHEKPDLQQLKK